MLALGAMAEVPVSLRSAISWILTAGLAGSAVNGQRHLPEPNCTNLDPFSSAAYVAISHVCTPFRIDSSPGAVLDSSS